MSDNPSFVTNPHEDDDLSAAGPVPKSMSALKRILSKVFSSCASDPKGSVHRAWGISLLFVVLYFSVAIVESTYQRERHLRIVL